MFEYIANKIKTKTYRQCYDFPRNLKYRVEVSHTAIPEEHAIHNILKKYNENKVIDSSNCATKEDSDNDSCTSSHDRDNDIICDDPDSTLKEDTTSNNNTSIISNSGHHLTLPTLPVTSRKLPAKKTLNKGLWLQDEIESLISALRAITNSTNYNNECVYKLMSQTVKTRNVRQCYDFV